jgi:DNA helicase-2/ATP-dependent DNA helicase PcrA
MDRIILVRCFRRRLFGRDEPATPSRFLYDLPSALLEGELLSLGAGQARAMDTLTRWDATPASGTPAARFRAGMRVLHRKFGEGIVMESRVEQDDEEVTIAFQSVGLKRLAASMAGLEILDDLAGGPRES